MLMIAAALEEELDAAKSLCRNVKKIQGEKAKLWEGALEGQPMVFLRAGVGPRKSAERLQEALNVCAPSQILVIGYAGALDPELKLGGLIALGKSTALRLDDAQAGWEYACTEAEFDLAPCPDFVRTAEEAGLTGVYGNGLTTPHVLGYPAHKQLLFQKFQAAVVDMETAALARVAKSAGLPLRCIRVVSDEAVDSFLAPFSYNPEVGIPRRTMQLIETGMVETYREWKAHSAVARECLIRFLSRYLAQNSKPEIRDGCAPA